MSKKVSKYIRFIVYCRKRRDFCKGYHRLKRDKIQGYIDQHRYFNSLKKIHTSALELELDYFDILHMRL